MSKMKFKIFKIRAFIFPITDVILFHHYSNGIKMKCYQKMFRIEILKYCKL